MKDGERSYEIEAVLGRGGFGAVYRARLRGAQDFSKTVAIKLLHEEHPPEEVLQRFRDEARILGLVNDRAIVGVDAPCMLGGRWAVVMEYVEGVSLARVLKARKSLSPDISLQLVAEIARSLERVWHAKGPGGQPLRLLHRDLKPANLQLTPSGDVKILDFGIAKADFERRETNTTSGIAGTRGYMAPERLGGVEGRTTDVYSLGVVLWQLLTGERPRGPNPKLPNGDAWLVMGLSLAQEMLDIDPDDRPTMAEVEERALALVDRQAQTLRAFAEEVVPQLMEPSTDGMVGSVLSETMGRDETTTVGRSLALAVGSSVMTVAVVGLLLAAVGVCAGVGWWSMRPDVVAAPALPEVAPQTPSPAPELAPPPEPSPVPEPAPEPSPSPDGVPIPVPVPVAEPAPVEVIEVAPAAEQFAVNVASLPPDAIVWVDGQQRGTTPLIGLSLAEGTHELLLRSGDRELRRQIRVGPRLARRFVWHVQEDRWESGL